MQSERNIRGGTKLPDAHGHGAETAMRSEKGVGYLARHANRLMIANDRLIKIEGDEVYFEYKDCCYRVALAG
ncbi:MAG: transposase [Planctomycetota bacterium]